MSLVTFGERDLLNSESLRAANRYSSRRLRRPVFVTVGRYYYRPLPALGIAANRYSSRRLRGPVEHCDYNPPGPRVCEKGRFSM